MTNLKINGHTKKIIGKTFGKLTVVSHKSRAEGYNCICACGNTTVARATRLKGGTHSSCGCVHHRKGQESPNYKGIGTLSKTHWYNIKYSAERRNLPFKISMADAWNLYLSQNKKCIYTGWDIVFGSVYRNIQTTASLDRIDSSKGYLIDNVQWVHVDVNYMKSDICPNQFLKICKAIASNFAVEGIALP